MSRNNTDEIFRTLAEPDARKIIFSILPDEKLTTLEIVAKTNLPESTVFVKVKKLEALGLIKMVGHEDIVHGGPKSKKYQSLILAVNIEISGPEPRMNLIRAS